jgi:hypothetical protein
VLELALHCVCSPARCPAHGDQRWIITIITVILIVGVLAQAGLTAEWLAAIAAMMGTALAYQQK